MAKRFANAGKEYLIIEHKTRSGKTLYGVIYPDLKYPEANAIDPHTWKVNGNYFVRSHYLVYLVDKGAVLPAQQRTFRGRHPYRA